MCSWEEPLIAQLRSLSLGNLSVGRSGAGVRLDGKWTHFGRSGREWGLRPVSQGLHTSALWSQAVACIGLVSPLGRDPLSDMLAFPGIPETGP